METTLYKIDGRNYKMFTLNILGKPMQVASYALNRKIAKMIEPYVDIIHVSAGTYQKTFGITHPSMFEEHGRNVFLAAEIKKHVSKPVATIGGLNDPEQLEDIIASGKADIVYMARALLSDPFLPRKIVENRPEEIVKCLRCFTCMAERAATSTRRWRCAWSRTSTST